jgi:threonine/homoserine/homoserine lactone efflux protein
MTTFLAFLGVSLMVIMTPGPDTALTIRNTLLGGRAGGIATAFGVATGLVVWASATSLGLLALLLASEPLFLAIKYAGAAYLVWLGAMSLREALFVRAIGAAAVAMPPGPRMSPAAAYRQGLLSNLGNPKIAVFFPSLLPQFAPDPTFAALLLLGLTFALLTLGWMLVYAVVVAKAGDVLRRDKVRRAIEAVTGTVLIGLGVRLAAEQR